MTKQDVWEPINSCTKSVPENTSKGKDPISPDHYSRWKIEPLKFIMTNNLPFWMGNVIKYIMRWDRKDGLQDLKKARSYLDHKIAELESEGVSGE